MTDLLLNGSPEAETVVILAHGAGAAMDTPFMTYFAEGLAEAGMLSVRFEFPYMARRRAEGGKRPPDRAPVLMQTWRDVMAEVRSRFSPRTLVIGGKSMGGRMASLVAAEDRAGCCDGLLMLGYPFHAAGKPGYAEKRLGHLPGLTTPMLICQGERDSLGGRESIADVPLADATRLLWLPDGDHSLKPRKASGHTLESNLRVSLGAAISFIGGL